VRYSRFFPADAKVAQWGISVTGAGVTDQPGRSVFSLRGLPDLYQFTWTSGRTLAEYAFLYVARGGGVFESIPTGAQNVAAGDAIVFFPGVWHRYRPDRDSGWKIYWVNGNGQQLQVLVQQEFFSPEHPVSRVSDRRAVSDSYQRLLDMVQHEGVGNPLLLSAAMLEIIARLCAPSDGGLPTSRCAALREALKSGNHHVARAVNFIWNSTHGALTVEDVVASARLTRRSLERRFQAALGHTIYDEIIRCRIERAKRLLEDTSLPVKQVALRVGFPNSDRMGKVFQRIVSVSPMAYRRCVGHS
jgi:AraC-like DNA-binding protein